MVKNTFTLLLLFLSFFSKESIAVDGSQHVTEVRTSGHWKVIEFSAPKQIIYRISSLSINNKKHYLTFDFVPSNKCVPDLAVMVTEFQRYNEKFNKGILPLSYKIPGMKEYTEIVKTQMEPGNNYAFFKFEKMSLPLLTKHNDKGKISVWIPGSEDGTVRRSDNIYFSLEGLDVAMKEASNLCSDNM